MTAFGGGQGAASFRFARFNSFPPIMLIGWDSPTFNHGLHLKPHSQARKAVVERELKRLISHYATPPTCGLFEHFFDTHSPFALQLPCFALSKKFKATAAVIEKRVWPKRKDRFLLRLRSLQNLGFAVTRDA